MMSPGALVGVQAQAHGPRLIFIFLIFFKGALFKKKDSKRLIACQAKQHVICKPRFCPPL